MVVKKNFGYQNLQEPRHDHYGKVSLRPAIPPGNYIFPLGNYSYSIAPGDHCRYNKLAQTCAVSIYFL